MGSASLSGVAITNAAGASAALSAIAYRPEIGAYFGYRGATDTVYSRNVTTGRVAAITSGGAASASAVGFDFNNVLDAARIVTANDENRVFFPEGHPGRASAPDIVSVTYPVLCAGRRERGGEPLCLRQRLHQRDPVPDHDHAICAGCADGFAGDPWQQRGHADDDRQDRGGRQADRLLRQRRDGHPVDGRGRQPRLRDPQHPRPAPGFMR
jgi:hypothetical protein